MRHLVSLIIFIIMLLSAGNVFGKISIGGYFEPQLSSVYFDDAFRQLNSNKLRIDMHSDITDNMTFTGNINYINYNGFTEWNMLDFVPNRLSSLIPDSLRQMYSLSYEDNNRLDNAYLRMYASIFTITVGRQQISIGSGYAWNPTDLFNTKEMLDPTYEQPGINGLRLDVGISTDYTFMLFYSPEDSWEQSAKLLRFTGRVSHFDYALSAGEITQTHTDYLNMQSNDEKRNMFGFDFNGELFGFGCWSENAYNKIKSSPAYWENVFGVDYTFSSGWYMMAEYFHSEIGEIKSDLYDFNDWLRYLSAEIKSLSRHQVYGYTLYPLTDLLNVGGSIIYGISDRSSLIIPTIEYSIDDNIMLTCFGSVYTGRDGSISSHNMGPGGLIRLKAYF
jgi:hypothetical protein